MISINRLKKIEELVRKEDFITLTRLAELLAISESTVRRDIAVLEKQQVVVRSQGGVVLADPIDANLIDLVSFREKTNIDIKRKIGLAAAELIKDGDNVFLDSSTTVREIARHLSPGLNITAVTNDLTIALELEKKPRINTIVLGGNLRQGTHSIIGPIAEANIKGMYFNKMFLSPGGISLEGHIMNYSLYSVELRKKVAAITEKIIVVADSSKFNKNAFITVLNFDQIATIVTDSIPENIAAALAGQIEIVIAR